MFDVLLIEVVSIDRIDRVDLILLRVVVDVEGLVLVDSCDSNVVGLFI